MMNFGSYSGPAAFVPSDLLENIFILLVQVDKLGASFTCQSAPINVSGVCHHWKEAAVHLKSLWSTLIADLNSSATISQHFMHFRYYLERCALTLLIDIALTVRYHSGPVRTFRPAEVPHGRIRCCVNIGSRVSYVWKCRDCSWRLWLDALQQVNHGVYDLGFLQL